MKAKSTEFAEGIKAALQGIQISNGYLTDLGLSVHRGFWAHVLDARHTAYPAVVIHPGSESPPNVHAAGKRAVLQVEAPLVIAVELSRGENAYDALQACTADVRKALMRARESFFPLGQANTLGIGEAIPNLSTDSRFALVAITVEMSIVETY